MNEGRILAIDYGLKRTGLAVTDPLRIIASPMDTVETSQLTSYLDRYIAREPVGLFLIGLPLHKNGTSTSIESNIQTFIRTLEKKFPSIPIIRRDESYTSVRAKEAILASGARKKKRQDKSLIDKVSAAILLQEYLEDHGPRL
jgi:putative Holliday junction resolvase